MGMLTLSSFLLIGIRNGCKCRQLDIELMIPLNGINGLGIFVRWRLLRMLGIL